MKKQVFISSIVLLSLMAIIGCGKKEAVQNKKDLATFSNDMEYVNWINTNTLSKDFAHSGRFSSKLDTVSEYSFGFSEYFKNISDTLPKVVNVNCWVLMPKKGTACQLVVNIDSSGKSIYWQGVELKDSVQNSNQWEEIRASFKLPQTLLPDNKISVYLWNNTKSFIYVDDLKVSFEK